MSHPWTRPGTPTPAAPCSVTPPAAYAELLLRWRHTPGVPLRPARPICTGRARRARPHQCVLHVLRASDAPDEPNRTRRSPRAASASAMAAASDKHRKDVAELEHRLEHNGDIRLLPTSTARSYAVPMCPTRPVCTHNTHRSRPPRRHGLLRCTAAASTAAQYLHAAMPLCVVEAATTQVLHGLLTVLPRPPRPPRRAAHLHRPTHGPEHRAAASEFRHRRHTSGKENDAQDKPAHDTNCLSLAYSLNHGDHRRQGTNKREREGTRFPGAQTPPTARTTPCISGELELRHTGHPRAYTL